MNSPKHATIKSKNKNMAKKMMVFLLAAIVFLGSRAFNKQKQQQQPQQQLNGNYLYNNDVLYSFDNGNSYMRVGDYDYKFSYKTTSDTLTIDFNDTSVKDAVYTYKLSGNKLVLKGQEGTTGQEYTLELSE